MSGYEFLKIRNFTFEAKPNGSIDRGAGKDDCG